MSALNPTNNSKSPASLWPWVVRILAATAMVGVTILIGLLLAFSGTPLGLQIGKAIAWVFAADTTQMTWYVTRAAGLTAYLLLWFSTIYGLAVSSRILDGLLHGSFTYDFHQFISLLAIGFVALHVVVLMADQYLPFTLAQVLFPFLSTYRPLWVSVGVLSLYIILLVTVTFYIRDRIGSKTFRSIHVLSLLGFFGAAVHGLFAGTDGPLPIVQLMYAGTVASVVFMTAYWLAALLLRKRQVAARQALARDTTRPLVRSR